MCTHFSQAAATLGLSTSWVKTKLQNLGSGPSLTSLQSMAIVLNPSIVLSTLAAYKNPKTIVIHVCNELQCVVRKYIQLQHDNWCHRTYTCFKAYLLFYSHKVLKRSHWSGSLITACCNDSSIKEDRQTFCRKWVESSFELFIATQTRVGSTSVSITSLNAEILKFLTAFLAISRSL